jgi:hypothetical protein
MGGTRQRREAEKALRERWEFRFGYWGMLLALAAFGYELADHHPYIASALFLAGLILIIGGLWFLNWPKSAKVVVTALLLSTFGLAEWTWLSKAAAEAAKAEELKKAMVAPTLTGWGAHDTGCVGTFDTSHLIQFRDTQYFYMACQVVDVGVDILQNTSIAVSNPFHITSEPFQIVINYDPNSAVAPLSRQAVKTGAMGQISTFTLPRDADVSKIKRLADVPAMGGTLWPKNDEQSMILPNH